MNLVERLRSHANWYISCAGGNIPDEAATEIEAADTIDRLQKGIETAREALKPFVRQMEREFPDQWPDAMDVRSLNESRWHLKVGDFRRAREAYAAIKDKEVAG